MKTISELGLESKYLKLLKKMVCMEIKINNVILENS